jgi:hypothetical protein
MIGLRHVAIRARDLARARRFDDEGPGLTWLGYRPSGVSMDLSDGAVNLTTLTAVRRPTTASAGEGQRVIHLDSLVEDVAAVNRHLLALGAAVVRAGLKERRAHDATSVPDGSLAVLAPVGNGLDISDRPAEWRTRAEAPARARAGEMG